MSVYLNDGDVTLYLGDALETVRAMPDESVDCVVTSPPYWGLRDYGTGEWDGGDPDCDHAKPTTTYNQGFNERWGQGGGQLKQEKKSEGQYAQECGKCGARRVDQQMGLEPTPDLFVAGMVELFREIRRVLAAHGTCWVNLGDSYASGPRGNAPDDWSSSGLTGVQTSSRYRETLAAGTAQTRDKTKVEGLKPKDLVGIPWRVAFALQQDGWWLRSDIIWAKPNPMPESVTDRPTKAHEYLFLLTKQPRYFFDQEAVREPHTPDGRHKTVHDHATDNSHPNYDNIGNGRERWPNGGRNVRSVWTIATQPYPEAHFATYPEELARRAILAGCPLRVCRVCGKPSERIVETEGEWRAQHERPAKHNGDVYRTNPGGGIAGANVSRERREVGWSDCGHNQWRPGVVLDPFIGSGTTAKVARDHQRHAIGIDLNREYLELAARRLQQLSLLT